MTAKEIARMRQLLRADYALPKRDHKRLLKLLKMAGAAGITK